MKLRSKKFAAICCAAVMAVACAIPAFAYSGACTVDTGDGLTVYVRAQFTPSETTSGQFGTRSGKHIRRCYVRIQEGNYDSQRVYNEGTPTGRNDSNSYQAYTSKINNPFATALTSYGWLYY